MTPSSVLLFRKAFFFLFAEVSGRHNLEPPFREAVLSCAGLFLPQQLYRRILLTQPFQLADERLVVGEDRCFRFALVVVDDRFLLNVGQIYADSSLLFSGFRKSCACFFLT